MKYVQQPMPSNLCGQACIAMILGTSITDAIRRVGTRGRTTYAQLIRALNDAGQGHGMISRITKHYRPPRCALVRVATEEDGKRYSHWVVWHHRWWYDPADTTIRKATDPRTTPMGGRVTSYLRIDKRMMQKGVE